MNKLTMMRSSSDLSTDGVGFFSSDWNIQGFRSDDEDMNLSIVSDLDAVPKDFDDAIESLRRQQQERVASSLTSTDFATELGFTVDIDMEYMQGLSMQSFANENKNVDELSFEERLRTSQVKLAESMKRTKESRKVLETPELERFSRRNSIRGVLSSVRRSSNSIESYITTKQTGIPEHCQYFDNTQLSC